MATKRKPILDGIATDLHGAQVSILLGVRIQYRRGSPLTETVLQEIPMCWWQDSSAIDGIVLQVKDSPPGSQELLKVATNKYFLWELEAESQKV